MIVVMVMIVVMPVIPIMTDKIGGNERSVEHPISNGLNLLIGQRRHTPRHAPATGGFIHGYFLYNIALIRTTRIDQQGAIRKLPTSGGDGSAWHMPFGQIQVRDGMALLVLARMAGKTMRVENCLHFVQCLASCCVLVICLNDAGVLGGQGIVHPQIGRTHLSPGCRVDNEYLVVVHIHPRPGVLEAEGFVKFDVPRHGNRNGMLKNHRLAALRPNLDANGMLPSTQAGIVDHTGITRVEGSACYSLLHVFPWTTARQGVVVLGGSINSEID